MKNILKTLFIAILLVFATTTFAALGDSSTPAKSCLQIKQEIPASADGVYWLQNGSMTTAKEYYCDMTTNGGGWQLLFQRAGGTNNRESCAGVFKNTLNDFLHDGACGDVNNITYGNSYNPDNVDTTIADFVPAEYMNVQFDASMTADTDDAFTIHTSTNLFPNSPANNVVVDIPVDKICDINNTNCDDTNGYWKYIGDSWFHSALCSAGNSANNSSYGGNYGYCHNGWNGQGSNSLFGNRIQYNETKLYKYPHWQGKDYMERVFIKPKAPEFDSITLESDNAKNTAYAKAGDKIKITIKLKEADTWKSSHNKPTFSIGSTTGLQTANYLGSTSPKISGYRNYTVLAGQNGTLSFTNLDFKNRNETSIVGFTPTYIPASNIIVDTTLPNINFTDDVSATLVASDDITITVTETNEDTASYEYGFSADATCDATDTYGNAFTSGTTFTISDSSNNGKYICAKAEDAAGNIAYKASANPLLVGQMTATPTTAPDLKNTSDSGSSDTDDVTNDTTPTITGSCIANSEVKIYVAGVATTDTATCTAGGTFEITLSSALANGNHNISFTQKQSGAGYQESNQSPNLAITIDTINPTNLTINVDTASPRDIDNPEITFSATDADSGIDHHTVQIDGGSTTTQTSPYTPSLSAASSHTVAVTVYDVAGNSINNSVTYPPTVNITSPTVIINTNITDTTIAINGPNPITSVNISGVTYTGFSCTPNPTATGVVGPVNCTLTITGSGTLTATATDTTGATGTASQTYTIETDNPVISFTKDTEPGPVQSDEIEIKVTDANPKVSSYQYGFSSDNTCDATDSYTTAFTTDTTFTITTDTNNGNYICAKAEDEAGNISYQASANPLNIDTTAPTATFAYSTTTPTNSDVTVTMTTSEAIATPAGWTQVNATTYTKTVSTNETNNFNIEDLAGNQTAVSYTVSNIDKENPTITLNGSNPQTVLNGSSYTEANATCTDNVSCTVTISGTVDTSTSGSYTVTYTAEDPAGNTIQTTRTVNVVSGGDPVITLIGANPQTITEGNSYVELGATATDTEDGNLTSSITINSSSVNTTQEGTYTVTYTVTDSSSNTATETRTVVVTKKKKSSSSIQYTCKDKKAINYDYFGRHKQSLCKYTKETTSPKEEKTPTTDNPFGGKQCSSNLLITDNMKNPSTDGRYSSYNKAVVTQVKLLQTHMNRLLLSDYGKEASGPVDGYFRTKTKTGVKRLQIKLNTLLKGKISPLDVDGIVGPFTKKAINQSC